jgi:hypothetical protein
LTLIEVAFVKVQKKTAGNYMVTIPREAVQGLGIKDSEKMKVYLDVESSRVIFELVGAPKKK